MYSALSDSTRVCVYDRAGLGFSDSPRALNMSNPAEAAVAKVRAEDHTALRMANDLAALLMKVWQFLGYSALLLGTRVDFDSYVPYMPPSVASAVGAHLPSSHQPRPNWADRGTHIIKVDLT